MTRVGDLQERADRALARSLELGEHGIQLAIYRRGERLAFSWAGVADGVGTPVTAETIFPVFSTTKAATAIAAHVQIERGLLDPDAPIASYWPGFGRNGKDRITLAHVLAHQSGIPQMPAGVTPERMSDWEWMVAGIEDFRPYFEPGTDNAYQSIVFGWLVGEAVRRSDPRDRPFGTFLQEEVFAPLGIGDFFVGLPVGEHGRVGLLRSQLSGPGGVTVEGATEMSLASKPEAVALDAAVHNRADIWRACLPGTGGIASADGVARLFAVLAGEGELAGHRLLPAQRVRACLVPRAHGDRLDLVLVGGNRWSPPLGTGGLWLGGTVLGDGPGVLCHAGLGNSIGFADLDSGVAVGITHNRLFADDMVVGPHPYEAIAELVRDVMAEPAATASGRHSTQRVQG